MKLEELISQLSLDEKFALLTGKNKWQTVSVDRLGIPAVFVSDGPHGLRKVDTDENGKETTRKATCFPTSSAMAATWNPELVYKAAKAMGRETGVNGVDILLGPGTNIKRTPVCGRNFEYYSEDPLLAGELAASYIEGVQSEGVGTSLKHFAANNQEFDRFQISSEVDIRVLRELYLKPFEIAVKKSKPDTVMCAYNRLNGVYCSENRFLLNDVLRREWGFDGFVISDWGAVHDRVKSLKASLELEMPFREKSADELKAAYESGRITDTELDEALLRMLKIVFKLADSREKRARTYSAAEHHQLAKAAALEAVTLLKNEDRVLPISKEKVKRLAVIGQLAKAPMFQGGGSSHVEVESFDAAVDRMTELAGSDIQIDFIPAYYTWRPNVNGLNLAMEAASRADTAVIFAGNRDRVELEGSDRGTIRLAHDMENLIERVASVNPNTVVVLQAGAAVDMSAWIGRVKAVVFAWYSGEAGGAATAEILFGAANPSGKTAETFPLCLEDTPAYPTYPGNGFASWYAEGLLVGYRYYDTVGKEVLFPFGHGLSYTAFLYSDLIITPDHASEDGRVLVSFRVKNTGSMEGKETVQLYVRDKICNVLRPDKELKAFTKVGLKPGEEKELNFTLDRGAFAYFNTSFNAWFVEGGQFEILVGASSRDIRLKGLVEIETSRDYYKTALSSGEGYFFDDD